MSLTRLLRIIIYLNLAVLGSAQDLQVHCLEGGEPLQLPDPFPPSKEDRDFVSLGWYFRPFNVSGGEQDEDKLMLYSTFDEFKTIDADNAGRWELYNYWGLQLRAPRFNDSGTYRAVLTTTSGQDEVVKTRIQVAESPKLKSEKLDVSRKVNTNTGEVTLSCGTLASLGSPAVKLYWLAPNGSELEGTYENGNLTLILSKEDAGTPLAVDQPLAKLEDGDGTFSCELSETSPSVTCISPEDLARWEGKYRFIRQGGQSETGIFIIVAVVCVLILIIVVVIVVIVLVRKKSRGEAYSTKDEEAKAENGNDKFEGGESSRPLMIQDDANPYDRPNAHTNTRHPYNVNLSSPGGHTASPYMVSGLNLPEGERSQPSPMQLPPKRNKPGKAPVAATESIDSADGNKGNGKTGGRYAKKGEARDTAKGDGDREPPIPKKRSIFMTESNEALDKIAEAVAGGKGSGADGGRAPESQV